MLHRRSCGRISQHSCMTKRLQTLALIQLNADDPSEAAALAHAQERELREWLYGADRASVTPAAVPSTTPHVPCSRQQRRPPPFPYLPLTAVYQPAAVLLRTPQRLPMSLKGSWPV